jgi:hypothetical protein
MRHHAESHTLGTQGRFSILDRPKSEFIVSAHRARGRLLREMTSALWEGLRLLVIKRLPKPKASPGAAR